MIRPTSAFGSFSTILASRADGSAFQTLRPPVGAIR